MLKSELIQTIANIQPEIPEYLVEDAINTLIDLMTLELCQGHRIEIRGFGAFALHYRAPRRAHNPKTGKKLLTDPKYILRFRAGKPLKERIK